MISDQIHALIVHTTFLRNTAHPTQDRSKLAGVVSRLEEIHRSVLELEGDAGTNSGNLDEYSQVLG